MNFNPFTGDGRLNRGNADLHVLEPLAPQEIISAYLSSELVRRAVDKPAQDLASAGIMLSLDGDESGEEIAQSFAEYLKRLDFSGHLFQVLSAARLWGGAGLIVWADDGLPMDEPLDLANCRTIRALTVASRWELIPVEWGDDPTVERGRLNEPVLYRYTPHVRQSSASTRSDFRSWHQYLRRGKKIHATRVLGFVGKKIPRHHNMMGLSSGFDFVLGSGWEGDTVYRALKARAADMATVFSSSSEFVRTASALILKSPEVRDVIEAFSQDDPGNPIKEKLEALRLRMNAFGLTAIAPDEEIVEVSRTAQGMQQLIDTVMVGLSAACYPSIPITFLFGLQPPGGLSGAGEADINNYYRALSEIRTQQYMGELRWLAKIVLSCQDGPTAGQVPAVWDLTPGEFGSQSEAEKLELESKRAALLKEYVDLRAIAPEEIRANLKSQENPLIQLSDEYDEALKTPDPGAADAGAQPDMGGMSALMGQQTAQEPTEAAQGMQPGQGQEIEQAAPQVIAQGQETTPTRQDEGDEEMKPIRLADGRIVVPQVLIVDADSAEAGLLSLAARQATQQEEASIRFAAQPSPVRMDETRFITMKHPEKEKGHVVPVEVDAKEGGGQTWSLPSGKTLELSPEKAKAHELKRAAIAKKIAATSKSPAVIAHHKQVAEELEAKHAPKPKAPEAAPKAASKAAPKITSPVITRDHSETLKRVRHALEKTESRYGLHGVYYHYNSHGEQVAVATNGHKLTIVPTVITPENNGRVFDKNGLLVDDHSYPKSYEHVIPSDDNEGRTPFDKEAAINALKSSNDKTAYILSEGGQTHIGLFTDEGIKKFPIGAAHPGESKVTLDRKYLLDSLQAIPKGADATLKIKKSKKSSPISLHDTSGMRQYIMPHRKEVAQIAEDIKAADMAAKKQKRDFKEADKAAEARLQAQASAPTPEPVQAPEPVKAQEPAPKAGTQDKAELRKQYNAQSQALIESHFDQLFAIPKTDISGMSKSDIQNELNRHDIFSKDITNKTASFNQYAVEKKHEILGDLLKKAKSEGISLNSERFNEVIQNEVRKRGKAFTERYFALKNALPHAQDRASAPEPEPVKAQEPAPMPTGKIQTTEYAPPAEAKAVYESLLKRFPNAEIRHHSDATGKARQVARSNSDSALDERSRWPQSVYFEDGKIHVRDHSPRSSEPYWAAEGKDSARQMVKDFASAQGTYGHTEDELVNAAGKFGQYLNSPAGAVTASALMSDLRAYAKGERGSRAVHRLQAAGIDLGRVEASTQAPKAQEPAPKAPKPATVPSTKAAPKAPEAAPVAAPVVAKDHASVLKRIGYAITKDMSNYGITGVYYHINKNKQPYAIATDGNRLSMVPIEANNEHMNKIIRSDGEHAEFEDFPDYEEAIPKNPKLEDVNRTSLSNAVQAIRKLFRSVPKPELTSLKGIYDKAQRSKIDKANRNALANHEYATSHIEFHNVNGDLYIKPKHIEGHQEYAGPSPKGLNTVVGMNVHYLNDVLKSMPNDASIKISFGQERTEKMRNDNAIQINGSDGSKHIIMPIR